MVQSFADDALTSCPQAGEAVSPFACVSPGEGVVKKVFSVPAITFKGDGFYKTDSRKAASNGSGRAKGDGSGTEAGTGADSAAGGKAGSGGDSGSTSADSKDGSGKSASKSGSDSKKTPAPV